MSESPTHARMPWVAAVLSLFCTGLGHIYCGRVATGLILFLASLLFAPLVMLAAFLAPSTPVLLALILGLLSVLGLYAFATVDAYRLARRAGAGFVSLDSNRGLIYALFLLVGVTYPVGVLHYLRANAFEAFLVPSDSEAPNVLPGDRILVNKAVLHRHPVQRGDVVVFRPPTDRRRQYVKRVIALSGDTVEIRSGRVRVNDKPLELDPIPAPAWRRSAHRPRAGLSRRATPAAGTRSSWPPPRDRPRTFRRRSSPKGRASCWATTATAPWTAASSASCRWVTSWVSCSTSIVRPPTGRASAPFAISRPLHLESNRVESFGAAHGPRRGRLHHRQARARPRSQAISRAWNSSRRRTSPYVIVPAQPADIRRLAAASQTGMTRGSKK
jgi:signal peptidase I